MKVLIACEFSGTVRDAFIQAGFDAMSCDLLPSDTEGPHYRGDVRDILDDEWDLMIAHPPCTYLCNSGVSRLVRKTEQKDWVPLQGSNLYLNLDRYLKMIAGAYLFKDPLNAPIPFIAVENPIMHKYAVSIVGKRQNQIVQPWQFGHGHTKATGFWLKNLPELKATNIVNGREPYVHHIPPSKDRWKLRSKTYTGIAKAIVEQWGVYVSQYR